MSLSGLFYRSLRPRTYRHLIARGQSHSPAVNPIPVMKSLANFFIRMPFIEIHNSITDFLKPQIRKFARRPAFRSGIQINKHNIGGGGIDFDISFHIIISHITDSVQTVTIIVFLDIVHCPEFCLRLLVKPTQKVPTDTYCRISAT
jgi:hypothetical protein